MCHFSAEKISLSFKRCYISKLKFQSNINKNILISLQKTQTELVAARTASLKDRTKLTQVMDSLYDRIVQIQNLEVQAKRLLEEKTILEEAEELTIADYSLVPGGRNDNHQYSG